MRIIDFPNRILVRIFNHVVQRTEYKDLDSIENLKSLMATCKKFYFIIDHNLTNGIGIDFTKLSIQRDCLPRLTRSIGTVSRIGELQKITVHVDNTGRVRKADFDLFQDLAIKICEARQGKRSFCFAN